MEPSDRNGVGAMLSALLECVRERTDASALLHEQVRLHRLDGTSLEGRTAVIDAICTRGSEAMLSLHREHDESIEVVLEVDGVPARLFFMMTATRREGVLDEIWMDQPPVTR